MILDTYYGIGIPIGLPLVDYIILLIIVGILYGACCFLENLFIINNNSKSKEQGFSRRGGKLKK